MMRRAEKDRSLVAFVAEATRMINLTTSDSSTWPGSLMRNSQAFGRS